MILRQQEGRVSLPRTRVAMSGVNPDPLIKKKLHIIS